MPYTFSKYPVISTFRVQSCRQYLLSQPILPFSDHKYVHTFEGQGNDNE